MEKKKEIEKKAEEYKETICDNLPERVYENIRRNKDKKIA